MYFFFLLSFFSFKVFSLDITDCHYIKENKTYTITVSNLLKLKGITYSKSINMPYTVFKSRKYKNIFVYSESFMKKLFDSIKNCDKVKTEKNRIKKINYSIFDVEKQKSPKRIANVVLNFDGDMNIVFGLVKINNYYMVYPPSNVEFINDKFKKEIFSYIIKIYRNKEKI